MTIACFPDKAPTGELARVLVKWLRYHPERLHEGKSFLAIEAFRSAFSCVAPALATAAPPTPAPKK